jgi:hypothetical protein
MNKQAFESKREQFTASLAEAFSSKIKEMGDDVRGVTWFSSEAETYTASRHPKAA